MRQITQDQILEEIKVCPKCQDPQCRQSSHRFGADEWLDAYDLGDEVILADDPNVEVIGARQLVSGVKTIAECKRE